MACTIQARPHFAHPVDGEPRLQVLDNHSGHLRMAWKPRKKQSELDAGDVKSLFRSLLDVSTIEPKPHKQDANNPSSRGNL